MFRSFRFFGKLRVEAENFADKLFDTSANLLEIFYDEQSGANKFSCFARVTRLKAGEALPGEPEKLPQPETNIFLKPAREKILKALSSRDFDKISFWIAKPSKGTPLVKQHKVTISGLVAIDQFRDPEKESPTERFPLVSQYEREKKKDIHRSHVIFGHGDSKLPHDLRLELGFAVPTLVDSAERTDDRASGGIAGIGGVYSTTTTKTQRFVLPHTRLVGFPGQMKVNLSDKILPFGHFGVAWEGKGNLIALRGSSSNPLLPMMRRLIYLIGLSKPIAQRIPETYLELLSAPSENSADEFNVTVACRSKFRYRELSLDLNEKLGAHFLEKPDKAKLYYLECFWKLCLRNADLVEGLTIEHDPSLDLSQNSHLYTNFRWEPEPFEPDKGVFGRKPRRDSLFRRKLRLYAGGLEEVSRLARETRDGLVATNSLPQSVLPSLSLKQKNRPLPLSLIAFPRGLICRYRLGELPELRRDRSQVQDAASLVDLGITVDTDPIYDSSERSELTRHVPHPSLRWLTSRRPNSKRIELVAKLPSLDTSAVENSGNKTNIQFGYDASVEIGVGTYISYHVGNGSKPQNVPIEARIGSIAVIGGNQLLAGADAPASFVAIRRRDRDKIDGRSKARSASTLDVTWEFILALDRAFPVTTDGSARRAGGATERSACSG